MTAAPVEVENPVLASAAGGTPKAGYNCNRCLDFTTVIMWETIGDGVTLERERPCPDCQPPVPEAGGQP